MKILKNAISMSIVLSMLFLGAPVLYAGDDEWADAGKVLAGVVGGVVGYHILSNMYGGACYTPARRSYRPRHMTVYRYAPYEYEEGYMEGYESGYSDGYRQSRYYAPYNRRKVVRYYYY